MSELNKSAWPFAGAGTEGGLDIDAIFGSSTPGSDVNPFDVSVMQEPALAEEQPTETPVSRVSENAASKPSVSDAAEEPNSTAAEPPNPAAIKQPKSTGKSKATAATAPQTAVPADTTPPETPNLNLISAAFEQQETQNTQQGLLEKSPFFFYGSAKEAIADTSMTFEELRIEKADDFPELAEGKKVSWTVEYGKVRRLITDPKGTTVSSVKAEIEQSKQFLDGLKKSKDKCPDCLVKPKVTAQSKGIASYKGVFLSLEEARKSDKVICLIPAGDGKVYERRKSELGEFIAPKDNVIDFQQIRAGFTPALPLIPMRLLHQVISFFRCYMRECEEFEVLAHILWDKENEEFAVHVPEQEVTKAHIDADLRRCTLPEERYLHYADIHSHNSMEAKFSPIDDRDEQATRLYIVLGRLDKFFPEISVRMSCGGTFVELDPATVLESMGAVFPREWNRSVKTVQSAPCKKRYAEQTDGWEGWPL